MANFTTAGSSVFPAGHVIQTKYIYQSSTYSNTGGFQQILTQSITPASTSNKILVHVAARCTWPDGTMTHGWHPMQVTRAGTQIGAPLYMGDDTPQFYRQSWISWNFVDTVPSAGSAVAYDFDGSSDYGDAMSVSTAHMTLQEIQG